MTQGSLHERYAEALRAHLAGGGEGSLARAYELGRGALLEGCSLLELVEIHQQARDLCLNGIQDPEVLPKLLRLEAQFQREALSSFEMAHRGFKESTTGIRQVLEFGMVLGHELRTPLTAVRASAGMLKEVLEAGRYEVAPELVDNILTGSRSLQQRVDELLDLVGLHSNTVTVRKAPTDPGALLLRLCKRLEPEALAAGLRLRTDIPAGLPCVELDPSRMEQVVFNLVQNAVKYGAAGQYVDVSARIEDDRLLIGVRDYGQGIAEWDRSRLFQPFSRVDQSGRGSHGLGIGLALCQAIVQAHGGIITLTSVSTGTSIAVLLPVVS